LGVRVPPSALTRPRDNELVEPGTSVSPHIEERIGRIAERGAALLQMAEDSLLAVPHGS
jgi:hypothetical protein